MKEEASWLYPIRHLGYLIDFITGTTRHASAILTATTATVQSIPARYHSRCRHLLENGVDLKLFTPTPWSALPSSTQALQIIFVGRFQPFKGIPMLLEAIAQLKNKFPIHLTIVGEGSLREQWENQAKHLQIHELITWYGQALSAEVAEQIQKAHVLCLPSVRESGGGVLLEAMACARPVIALKYGGPAEIIDDKIGCAIPIEGGPTAVIASLVDCISGIFKEPEVWQQKGIVARQRTEQLYGWDAKINQALILYQELLKTPPRNDAERDALHSQREVGNDKI
ncbi:glycosyl transferase, group 1 [Beggiatoa sp. PS]|nr:glycosyl transferase, group 1 [Beggiatoa sp. PS]